MDHDETTGSLECGRSVVDNARVEKSTTTNSRSGIDGASAAASSIRFVLVRPSHPGKQALFPQSLYQTAVCL